VHAHNLWLWYRLNKVGDVVVVALPITRPEKASIASLSSRWPKEPCSIGANLLDS
jgi:hypothetical protein